MAPPCRLHRGWIAIRFRPTPGLRRHGKRHHSHRGRGRVHRVEERDRSLHRVVGRVRQVGHLRAQRGCRSHLAACRHLRHRDAVAIAAVNAVKVEPLAGVVELRVSIRVVYGLSVVASARDRRAGGRSSGVASRTRGGSVAAPPVVGGRRGPVPGSLVASHGRPVFVEAVFPWMRAYGFVNARGLPGCTSRQSPPPSPALAAFVTKVDMVISAAVLKG